MPQTIEQKKALAYDLIAAIENLQIQLNKLNAEIAQLQQQQRAEATSPNELKVVTE